MAQPGWLPCFDTAIVVDFLFVIFAEAHRMDQPSLVGGDWNMNFIFPYIGNNHPNWLIFFKMVKTTNQIRCCFCPIDTPCSSPFFAKLQMSKSAFYEFFAWRWQSAQVEVAA